MVPLRRIAGNHLADESGQEEHCPGKDRDKGDIEERLVSDRAEAQSMRLVDKLFDDDPYSTQESEQEHQYARKPEKVHRLLAEGAQEPFSIIPTRRF